MKEEKLTGRGKAKLVVRYLRPVAWLFALGLLMSLFSQVFNALIPQIVRVTVDSVLGTEKPQLPAALAGALPIEALRADPAMALVWAAGAVVRAFPDVLAQALPAPLCAEGLDAVPPEVALRLAHALHAAPDPGAALAALRLPKRTERAVRELIAHFGAPRPKTPAQARRLLRDIGPERAAELARLRAWPPGALEEALARGDAYSIPQLAITGADLAAAGIPAGPGVGRLLRALLDGVVEGEIENERASLLRAAQRWNLPEEESCR